MLLTGQHQLHVVLRPDPVKREVNKNLTVILNDLSAYGARVATRYATGGVGEWAERFGGRCPTRTELVTRSADYGHEVINNPGAESAIGAPQRSAANRRHRSMREGFVSDRAT
jgi:hypothetical protein